MRPLIKVLILVTACGLIGGCSQQTQRPVPKFTGRLLLLSGSAANTTDLMELTPSADGISYNLSTIANGVIEATPRADQTELLYTTKSEIGIVNVQSGGTKPAIKAQG